MFRKNGTILPYNEISHLRMENLNFVLNLRSSQEELKKKPETKTRAKESRDVEQTPIQASISELKMAANVKCGLPGCVEVGNQIYAAMTERTKLYEQIRDTSIDLKDVEDYYNAISDQTKEILKNQHEQQMKLLSLGEKQNVELKFRMEDVKSSRRDLERQLREKEKELRTLKDQFNRKLDEKEKKNRKNFETEIVFKDYRDETVKHLKHNGNLFVDASGKRIWSCCYAGEENSVGCIDENSVGVKSQLDRIKLGFMANYTEYNNHSLSSPVDKSRRPYSASPAPAKHNFLNARTSSYNNDTTFALKPYSSKADKAVRYSESELYEKSSHAHSHFPGSKKHLHPTGWNLSTNDHSVSKQSKDFYHPKALLTSSKELYSRLKDDPVHGASTLSNHPGRSSNLGKMREVSSRGEISRNRPMTAPLGFSLYTR